MLVALRTSSRTSPCTALVQVIMIMIIILLGGISWGDCVPKGISIYLGRYRGGGGLRKISSSGNNNSNNIGPLCNVGQLHDSEKGNSTKSHPKEMRL